MTYNECAEAVIKRRHLAVSLDTVEERATSAPRCMVDRYVRGRISNGKGRYHGAEGDHPRWSYMQSLLPTLKWTQTRSSAIAERPRGASCQSIVSFNSTIRLVQSFIMGARSA